MNARRAALLLALALAPAPSAASPPTPIPGGVIELKVFTTDDVEAWERIGQRSDSRPLTLAELEKLAAAGVGERTLIDMMRTRKVLALADADTLVRLKKAGATDAVVAAVSTYAWPPNDGFDLRVDLDVATPYGVGRAPFLYVEVWNPRKERQEAFLRSDLRGLMKKGARVAVARDRSDPLLPETVRSLRLHARVPSRDAGPLELRVLVTQRPGLSDLAGLPAAEEKRARRLQIDYPAVSLESRCRLELRLGRDPLLKDEFALEHADVECRWD